MKILIHTLRNVQNLISYDRWYQICHFCISQRNDDNNKKSQSNLEELHRHPSCREWTRLLQCPV